MRSFRNWVSTAASVVIFLSSARSIPASSCQPWSPLPQRSSSHWRKGLTAEWSACAARHDQCSNVWLLVEVIQGCDNVVDHGLRKGIALRRPIQLQDRDTIRRQQHPDEIGRHCLARVFSLCVIATSARGMIGGRIYSVSLHDRIVNLSYLAGDHARGRC